VVIDNGQVLVLRPGDRGYVEAIADRLASGDVTDEALSNAAREVWGPKADSA
jgi:hypothetical protein